MDPKKIYRTAIDTIPRCGTCDSYQRELAEGDSGAVSGVSEICKARLFMDVTENQIGCDLHPKYPEGDIPEVSTLVMLDPEGGDGYNNPTIDSPYIVDDLADLITAYAMKRGEGITEKAPLICRMIRLVVHGYLKRFFEETVTRYVQGIGEVSCAWMRNYIERRCETLKQEMMQYVQDYVQEQSGDGGGRHRRDEGGG